MRKVEATIKLIEFVCEDQLIEYFYHIFTSDADLAQYISLRLRWHEKNSIRHARYVASLKTPYLYIERTLSTKLELMSLIDAYKFATVENGLL